MQTLDPISLADGVTDVIPLDSTTIGVLIANESPLAISLDLIGSSRWLPAWTMDYVPVQPMQAVGGRMAITPKNITSAANSPSSIALVSIYSQGDTIAGIYPCSLTRQTNIGNGAIPTTATNSLINDGNAANTQVIETTPTGQASSAFVLDNMGNLTLRTLDNNVWSVIMSVVQNALGAATKLFHGTADAANSVPASGVTAGFAPTGVEIGTDSTHKISLNNLGGGAQVGVINAGKAAWMSSDINTGLMFGAYFNGTNYVTLSNNGKFAAQLLLSTDGLGGTIPYWNVRYSTGLATGAGQNVTWNHWSVLPTMIDSNGVGGAHIFTGTASPTGPVAGDLWFNA